MITQSIISPSEIAELAKRIQPLIGVHFDLLRIPRDALIGFEPSQIGTIVGSLMDASIPQLDKLVAADVILEEIGLQKHEGVLGDREGYPDYKHASGKRLELKLLYIDPIDVPMKKPPTPREPSARLTQKVTVKNVIPDLDVLMVVAYQLRSTHHDPAMFSPTIVDVGLFPMMECILARDHRLLAKGGKWFGNYETPAILSKIGKKKKLNGETINYDGYGRKESEGYHLNEDTNFGKLKRVPYEPLQRFLKTHGAIYASSGTYPKPWKIAENGGQDELDLDPDDQE